MAAAMMSANMLRQMRHYGKGNFAPERSERRQAVVDAARARQAAAVAEARRRRTVRPRRGR
jgi:hypothetical protein